MSEISTLVTTEHFRYLAERTTREDAFLKSLKAVGNMADSREEVRKAVMATTNYSGALGTWSFDANGDISLGYWGGRSAGGTTTWSFVQTVVP